MKKIFQAFTDSIMEEEKRLLGEGFAVKIMEVPKNNGVIWTGLEISEIMNPVTVIIYLEKYFPLYVHGESIEELAKKIYKDYQIQANMEMVPFNAYSLLDYDSIKKNIVYRLVNAKMNEKNLSQISYIPITDLAIIFYIYLKDYKDGRLFSVITDQIMKYWGTSLHELFSLATENTMRMFPAKLNTMGDILEEIAPEGGLQWKDSEYSVPFYILTNESHLNGSVSILYPGMLEQIAEKLKDDLLIIPSSIHEVILLPYHQGLSLCNIENIIMEVNQEQVAISEWLSDHAYIYRHNCNQIRLVLNGKEITPGFLLNQLCQE